jgi:hypothetical protein
MRERLPRGSRSVSQAAWTGLGNPRSLASTATNWREAEAAQTERK